MIDRQRVRKSFAKQASHYEDRASVQKRVISRFLTFLKKEIVAPASFVDVGFGTGVLLDSLCNRYGDSFAVGVDLADGMCRVARENMDRAKRIHVVNADAEQLPFLGGIFDLAVSTSTFQWLVNLELAFTEVNRVLKPGGVFMFTLFGRRTLHELSTSYQLALSAAGCAESGADNKFFSREDVVSALERTGFVGNCIFEELDTEMHDDVPALLYSLKKIGAGNASPSSLRGLAGRTVLLDMAKRYESEFAIDGSIPATYQILYCKGVKPL